MALRTVVIEGDEILRKVCKPVKEVTPKIVETLHDMLETMREEYGVGLAAPQVGIMRRMFVAQPDPEDMDRVYYMINPEILVMGDTFNESEEGCLSVPDVIGTVKRADYIKMRAVDIDGEIKEYEFHDFDARVMQHEYDHLEGILFIDKATNIHEPQYEEE